ncbi:hypothetical protein BWI93_01025 [Siphonobacter sp. BAB-5385]|nr:hypothetical protein BWI93_01025 [Siphonobacter sp. BAB-5385]
MAKGGVKLALDPEGEEQEFSHDHAQAILRYQTITGLSGWSLPKKSKLHFDGETLSTRTANVSGEAEEQNGDSSSGE